MAFFKMNYGFYPPYTVLVDPQFMEACHQKKVNIERMLPKILNGKVRICVTSCIKNIINNEGIDIPKLSIHKCGHQTHLSAEECLLAVIEDNPKFCIAVQDEGLRKKLGKIPGIPLIYLTNNIVMLEPPSGASKHEIEEESRSHISAPTNIRKFAKKVRKDDKYEDTIEDTSNLNIALRFMNKKNKKSKRT